MPEKNETVTQPINHTQDEQQPPPAVAEPTAEELEVEFERTRRIVTARHTLRVRDELNDFMRKNPALTLQESILAVFRVAERELAELEPSKPQEGPTHD
jgi:hypothetical protein